MGVDGTASNPVEEYLASIQAVQERQRSIGMEEQFLVDEELIPESGS